MTTIILNKDQTSFTFNSNPPESSDALWLKECQMWHPYYVELETKRFNYMQTSDGKILAFSSNSDKSTVDPSAVLPDLVDLHLNSSNCYIIIKISQFPHLNTLDLSFTKIQELDLSNCHDLRVLCLCQCQFLTKITGLADVALETLALTDSKVQLEELHCQNLRHVNMYETDCSKLKLLDLVPNQIEFMDLFNFQCYNDIIQHLPQFSKCKVFGMREAQLKADDLDFANCSALEDLDLSYSLVNETEILDLPTQQMKALFLECTPLQMIDLTRFPALFELNLNQTSIMSLELPENSALEVLKLSQTLLQQIDCRGQQLHLHELDISESQIAVLQFEMFPNLTYFDAFKCGIIKLEAERVPLLKSLFCAESQLKQCDFTALTALEECDVSMTALSDIDLSKCVNLQSFSCCDCPVVEIKIGKDSNAAVQKNDDCKLIKV